VIEIRNVLANDPVEMSLTQNENMIQALAPHTADEPLADRIGSRCFQRGLEHLNLSVLGHSGEASSILLIVIADQKAMSLSIGRGFPDPLGDPDITR
jgi:hypothetical protein